MSASHAGLNYMLFGCRVTHSYGRWARFLEFMNVGSGSQVARADTHTGCIFQSHPRLQLRDVRTSAFSVGTRN